MYLNQHTGSSEMQLSPKHADLLHRLTTVTEKPFDWRFCSSRFYYN